MFGALFIFFFDLLLAGLDAIAIGVVIAPIFQYLATRGIEWKVRSKGGSGSGKQIKKSAEKWGKRVVRRFSGVIPVLPTTTAVFLWMALEHNSAVEKAHAQKKIEKPTILSSIQGQALLEKEETFPQGYTADAPSRSKRKAA